MSLDPNHILPIVVGVDLQSEATDRGAAYDLCERIEGWLDAHAPQIELLPLVISDVWYMNHGPLRQRPTISIGPPEHNAAAANLFPRLPTALQIDDRLRVQLDVEFIDLRVSLFGSDPQQTAAAVELFQRRHLEPYLAAVVRHA